ncbi:MAG: LD-carboxypeptidase [Deltaproteobacteria bacterium]|nr:LD-carboxypeptidase [Deltaproteobacteria bacterium]
MSAPVFLPPGSRFGIFAPAGLTQGARLQTVKAVLAQEGYPVRTGFKACKSFRKYLAGTDLERLESFKRLWAAEVDAFLARRGGYGCQRLLGAIGDWSEVPNGKPIIGFSDLTALHLSRYKHTGAGGWHAAMADKLAVLGEGDRRDFFSGISGLAESFWRLPKKSSLKPGEQESSGPLLGGNLATICALLGTGHLPSFDGAVLMLEEVNEEGYRVDRLLTSLFMSIDPGRLKGLVFGDFHHCGPPAVVKSILKEAASYLSQDAPAVMGAPFGHFSPNRPWWIGETARLSASAETGLAVLRFLERGDCSGDGQPELPGDPGGR